MFLISKEFKKKFQSIWADVGDALSKQYSGAASTTSDLTRKGETNFVDDISSKINSVKRFFKNNFADIYKQNSIDIILGKQKDTNNCVNK